MPTVYPHREWREVTPKSATLCCFVMFPFTSPLPTHNPRHLMARPRDKRRGDNEGRHGATPIHCCNEEKEWLATYSDCREKDQPIRQCTGCQKTADERGGGRRRHCEVHSKKTWERWVLAGMEPTGSPVIVRDEGFSSPDALRGTDRPKPK